MVIIILAIVSIGVFLNGIGSSQNENAVAKVITMEMHGKAGK